MSRLQRVSVLLGSMLLASLAHAQGAPDDGSTADIPPPPTDVGAPPTELVVAPLLAAAEADLGAGLPGLALARATFAAEVLPEGVPLRVRADGLRVLAGQRVPEGAPAPSADEILVPLVAQADLDLRASQPQLALARLELALSRLAPGTPLAARAVELHRVAASMLGIAPPLGLSMPPRRLPPLASPPRRPEGHRGTGEMVELYIMAAGLGVLTGGYLPFVISDGTTGGVTYPFSMVAGGALMAVATLTLDLVAQLPTGLPPTISASIRFGLGHGLLAAALYGSEHVDVDANAAFGLVWGGAVLGAVTGLAVGFGLTPTLAEARLVESTGYWGVALGSFVAMMTELQDPTAAWATMLAALDAGLLVGLLMTSVGAVPSTRRTLFLDLGVLIGAAAGALVPAAYYVYADERVDAAPFGAGMLVGSLAGWIVTYLLTDGMDTAQGDAPDVQLGLAPLEGGASMTASGAF